MWRSAQRDAAHRPVGGDAVDPPSVGRASSDVPTSRASRGTAPSSSRVVRNARRDASDALEMHVSVYNLPSALTRRTPRVFVALLVEAPPAAKVPMHRVSRGIVPPRGAGKDASSTPTPPPRDASTRAARHRDWIVAGCTEPAVVPKNARATRFCVPVRVDGLAGPLGPGHLERLRSRSKRAALALYRIPDADDADDLYVFADENLPMLSRGVVTTERLDDMEYLGETAVDLRRVLLAIANKAGSSGEMKNARDHYALTRNPARVTSSSAADASLEDDGVVLPRTPRAFANDAFGNGRPSVRDERRAETSETASFSYPSGDRKRRLRPTAGRGPVGLAILAAPPLTHPPLPPSETGRVIADFLVTFPAPRMDTFGAFAETRSAYVRLCRWAGDGFQPVYSSLVSGSEEEVAVEPFVSGGGANARATARAKTLIARVPTMHIPVACLRGGGASAREPDRAPRLGARRKEKGKGASPDDASRSIRETVEPYPLPSPDAPWRLEIVARLADGRDALVGAVELTPGELAAAGARAALGDGPAALRCDELDARDFGDFDVSAPPDAARAVVLVERWQVRAGTRTRQTWRGGLGGIVSGDDGAEGDATPRTRVAFRNDNHDDDDHDDGKRGVEPRGVTGTGLTGLTGLDPFSTRSWTPSDSDFSDSAPSDSERGTRRRRARAVVAPTRAPLERAARVGGDDVAASHAAPEVPTDCVTAAPRTAAERKFRPDPRLVAAADDAVRAAVADRLHGETRGELVEAALRVRRELVTKLAGELRVLEQRARREARAGLGTRGKRIASGAAARRDASRGERRGANARGEYIEKV